MSAGVTYEGALQSSSGTATMFQGKRFWVGQRVPMRPTLIAYIKSNGGQLEPLEKNADYLIADHARRQLAPADAITWKWIEDSVTAGRLLNIDEYRINKAKAGTSQPSTGRQGARAGRTPFTDEDDKLLIAWVKGALEDGSPLLGLEIYKRLAEKVPRHTFHSWRDRWVKKLRFLEGVLDGVSIPPSPKLATGRQKPVPQPSQAEQPRGTNQNTVANPARPSAAVEPPRPRVAPNRPQSSPTAARRGPGPSATAASPRPSVVPGLSRPKVPPLRPPRNAAAEAPSPVAPPDDAEWSATAISQQLNRYPEQAESSAVAERSRPRGTREHVKPSAVVESPKLSAVAPPAEPTVRPGYEPLGVTPQPPRPNAAPEIARSSSMAPQTTPINTVLRSPELSSTLKRRSIFTEEDDALLAEYVQEMWTEHGKEADANLDIFADLEQDLPQHSARVWRHRWIRYLRPRLFRLGHQGSGEGPTVTETPQISSAIQQPQLGTVGLLSSAPLTKPITPETRRQKGKEVLQAPVSDPARSRSFAPDSTPEVPQHGATTSRVGQMRGAARWTTLTSPTGHKQYRDNMSEPSLGADPGYTDEGGFETTPIWGSSPLMDDMARHMITSHVFAEPLDNVVSERRLFARDYETFWYANGARRERFNSWPTIRGRTFDLFDLWKAATSQHAVPAERDWEIIAEQLGFDWVKMDGVQNELANYFEEHLGKFEELMADFEDDEESIGEDEDAATSEAEMPQRQSKKGTFNEAGPGSSRQPFNSSPPKLSSLKRTRDAASLAYPEVEAKRRKFDRSTEISSTPDHKNGTTHLRKSAVSAAVSPSDQRISTLPRSSQSHKALCRPMGSPSPREARRAVAEPETQDFHYDAETQDVVFYSHPSAADRSKSQSEADLTASQQLTLESEGFLEVPSSARTPKKSRGAAHISPLRRQVTKDPFLDSPDDEPQAPMPMPKPKFGKGRNPLLPAPAPTAMQKRQSLPWSQVREAGSGPRPAEQTARDPAAATMRPRFIRPPRSDEPSSPANRGARTPGDQADLPNDDAAPIPASCDPREVKYLRRVLQDWERRGYARDVALRGLDATTWATDISGDVIELLQRGEPVPEDWFGVWTEADDQRLAIVDGRESHPPKLGSERFAHRRARALRRLERKFDAECMETRRHWLSMKHALQEANMQL